MPKSNSQRPDSSKEQPEDRHPYLVRGIIFASLDLVVIIGVMSIAYAWDMPWRAAGLFTAVLVATVTATIGSVVIFRGNSVNKSTQPTRPEPKAPVDDSVDQPTPTEAESPQENQESDVAAAENASREFEDSIILYTRYSYWKFLLSVLPVVAIALAIIAGLELVHTHLDVKAIDNRWYIGVIIVTAVYMLISWCLTYLCRAVIVTRERVIDYTNIPFFTTRSPNLAYRGEGSNDVYQKFIDKIFRSCRLSVDGVASNQSESRFQPLKWIPVKHMDLLKKHFGIPSKDQVKAAKQKWRQPGN